MVVKMITKGTIARQRPKKKWLDIIENNVRAAGMCLRDKRDCDIRHVQKGV